MSWAKGQTSGWAAFNLKQRQKQGLESEVNKDPFPPISSTLGSLQPSEKLLKNIHDPVNSFSSVLLPSKNFPPLKENGNSKTTMLGCDSGGKYCSTIPLKDVSLAIKKLKEHHCWAENSLIEDVLAAVHNDVIKASNLLETMAFSVNFEELKLDSSVNFKEHKMASAVSFGEQKMASAVSIGEQKMDSTVNFEDQNGSTIPGSTTSDDIPCDEKADKSLSLGNIMDLTPFSSTLSSHLKDLEDGNASSAQRFSDDGNLRCNTGPLNSVPVEPEWEEDDVYISHRMDALRVMRYEC